MTGSGMAPVSIPLSDGTQLSVTPAGVQLGTRFFELASIQDARQVSPDPETFALRVAGAGLIEFQPARQGDGNIALDALFRFRPDLRPAGFIGPSGSPPYPPPSLYPPPFLPPPAYGAPVGGYPPPPGYSYLPGPSPRPAYYGANPNAQQGELTPYPRTFGELLSAVFQLYGKHIRKWLSLGFWVILLPGILLAVAQAGVELLLGINPFAASPLPQQIPIGANCLPILPASAVRYLTVAGAVLAGSAIVNVLISAWQTASFANAGREAVLSRPVPVGPSLGRGARRLFPTLGTSIVVILALLAALAPGIVCIVVSLAGLGLSGSASAGLCASQGLTTGSVSSTSVSPSASAYALLSCVGFLLLLAGAIFGLFLSIRLAVAPVIAATEHAGIGTAISRSWRLTYRSWWRCFGVILIIALVVVLVTLTVSEIEAIPIAAVVILASPLAQWIIAPLQELSRIVLLYDLRLRREGYAAITQTANAPTPVGAVPYAPPYEPPPAQG